MSASENSGLIDWYLARLRSRRMEAARLTPRALMKTDRELIGEIVNQASQSRDAQTEKIFAKLASSASVFSQLELGVAILAVLGTFAAFCLVRL